MFTWKKVPPNWSFIGQISNYLQLKPRWLTDWQWVFSLAPYLVNMFTWQQDLSRSFNYQIIRWLTMCFLLLKLRQQVDTSQLYRFIKALCVTRNSEILAASLTTDMWCLLQAGRRWTCPHPGCQWSSSSSQSLSPPSSSPSSPSSPSSSSPSSGCAKGSVPARQKWSGPYRLAGGSGQSYSSSQLWPLCSS